VPVNAFLIALALGAGSTRNDATAGTAGAQLQGGDRLLKEAEAAYGRGDLAAASRKLKRAIDAREFARRRLFGKCLALWEHRCEHACDHPLARVHPKATTR
jgi:hypothetical protein